MAPKRKATKQGRRKGATTRKRTKTDEGGDTSSDKVPASLFTMPAELRNYIYELALVAPQGATTIVTKDLKPPGLLATNRQIRSECRKIWYFQNDFTFHVLDCDARLLAAFMAFVEPVETASDRYVKTSAYCVRTGASCRNLLDWCRVVREHGCAFSQPDHPGDDDDYMTVVVAAHRIADAHSVGKGSWEMCLESLKPSRFVAGKLDPQWLEG